MRKTITAALFSLFLATMVSAQEFTNMPSPNTPDCHISYSKLTSQSYKVDGKPDIESFFLALSPGLGFTDLKQTKEDIKQGNYFEMDKKNGYISYGCEGDGSENIQSCYWNTKTKQKMVAVYYDKHDSYLDEETMENSYLSTSFLAFFLYDEKTQTLESIEPPMKEPLEMPKAEPIKREGYTSYVHFLCRLPQKGKNIEYRFGDENDGKEDWHTLTYNGLMFEEEVKTKKK